MDTNQNKSEEKREAERFSEHVVVMVRLLQAQNEGPGSGFMCPLKNISPKGVCLYSERPLQTGQPLELWLKAKEPSEALILEALVIHCIPQPDNKGYDIGVEILPKSNLSFDNWKKLFNK